MKLPNAALVCLALANISLVVQASPLRHSTDDSGMGLVARGDPRESGNKNVIESGKGDKFRRKKDHSSSSSSANDNTIRIGGLYVGGGIKIEGDGRPVSFGNREIRTTPGQVFEHSGPYIQPPMTIRAGRMVPHNDDEPSSGSPVSPNIPTNSASQEFHFGEVDLSPLGDLDHQTREAILRALRDIPDDPTSDSHQVVSPDRHESSQFPPGFPFPQGHPFNKSAKNKKNPFSERRPSIRITAQLPSSSSSSRPRIVQNPSSPKHQESVDLNPAVGEASESRKQDVEQNKYFHQLAPLFNVEPTDSNQSPKSKEGSRVSSPDQRAIERALSSSAGSSPRHSTSSYQRAIERALLSSPDSSRRQSTSSRGSEDSVGESDKSSRSSSRRQSTSSRGSEDSVGESDKSSGSSSPRSTQAPQDHNRPFASTSDNRLRFDDDGSFVPGHDHVTVEQSGGKRVIKGGINIGPEMVRARNGKPISFLNTRIGPPRPPN